MAAENPSGGSPIAFQPEPAGQTPWIAVIIAGVSIAALVGLGILLSRGTHPPPDGASSAYAAQLKVGDLKMSEAQNFIGATVTYIEGTVTNAGDKTVSGASLEATFTNSLGEIVQRELLPLQILDRSGPYPDARDLRTTPLKPHESREFRLTLGHVSADWNRQYPAMRVVRISLQ
jgi:hypothetical protein